MSKLYHPARPIEVETDERGCPVALRWRGMCSRGRCLDHWRVHTGWWEDEVLRDCYLFEGPYLFCEIYLDAFQGRWYMHRMYD